VTAPLVGMTPAAGAASSESDLVHPRIYRGGVSDWETSSLRFYLMGMLGAIDLMIGANVGTPSAYQVRQPPAGVDFRQAKGCCPWLLPGDEPRPSGSRG
jgi:hypothetical protein